MIAMVAANIAITWKPGFRVREALETKKDAAEIRGSKHSNVFSL